MDEFPSQLPTYAKSKAERRKGRRQMSLRFYVDLQTLRGKLDAGEISDLEKFLKSQQVSVVHLRGRRFESSDDGFFVNYHHSVAFATIPEDIGPIVKRISLHDDFTANPQRVRGLYENGTAKGELELEQGDGCMELVRRYKLEIVAEGGDPAKMLDDVRDLYFGIKEGTIEPKRFYGDKPMPAPQEPRIEDPEVTERPKADAGASDRMFLKDSSGLKIPISLGFNTDLPELPTDVPSEPQLGSAGAEGSADTKASDKKASTDAEPETKRHIVRDRSGIMVEVDTTPIVILDARKKGE
jgi:hypothetical protein